MKCLLDKSLIDEETKEITKDCDCQKTCCEVCSNLKNCNKPCKLFERQYNCSETCDFYNVIQLRQFQKLFYLAKARFFIFLSNMHIIW